METEWLNYSEAIFYACSYGAAFFTGLARSLNQDMFKSWNVCLSVGCLAGFVGFITVSLFVGWRFDGTLTVPWPLLGLSALTGLFAKQQVSLIDVIASFFPGIIKRYVGKLTGNEKSNQPDDNH